MRRQRSRSDWWYRLSGFLFYSQSSFGFWARIAIWGSVVVALIIAGALALDKAFPYTPKDTYTLTITAVPLDGQAQLPAGVKPKAHVNLDFADKSAVNEDITVFPYVFEQKVYDDNVTFNLRAQVTTTGPAAYRLTCTAVYKQNGAKHKPRTVTTDGPANAITCTSPPRRR